MTNCIVCLVLGFKMKDVDWKPYAPQQVCIAFLDKVDIELAVVVEKDM